MTKHEQQLGQEMLTILADARHYTNSLAYVHSHFKDKGIEHKVEPRLIAFLVELGLLKHEVTPAPHNDELLHLTVKGFDAQEMGLEKFDRLRLDREDAKHLADLASIKHQKWTIIGLIVNAFFAIINVIILTTGK